MSTALVTGEVLFDIFEDGSRVLGGAPFNVAWHLHGLGINPVFVSSVGQDDSGDDIRNAMTSWGMDTSALQTDTEHPTGSVQVSLKKGSPSFDIVEGVAYDFIEPPSLQNQVKNCKIMYHGSLAMRSPMTRQTILGLRKDSGLPVFVDVNLRAPFWDTDSVRGLINGADWVKLNDEEILLLSDNNKGELTDVAVRFREENSIQGVIVTLGEQGAFIVTENDLVKVDAGPVTKLVDTVGAGDGFSAMTIAGLLQGWDLREVLEAASLFAAKICGLRGALSRDRAFYDDFLDDIH